MRCCRYVSRLVVLVCCVLGTWSAHAAAREVVVSTFEYPPMMSASLPNDGVIGEIVHAAFREAGVTARFEYIPPKRIVEAHITGQDFACVVSPTNTIKRMTEEQRQHVLAATPLTNILMSLVYYKPNQPKPVTFNGVEDLKAYAMTVIQGSNYTAKLREAGVAVEEVTLDSQIRMLQGGRNDLTLMGYLSARNKIMELFPQEVDNFVIMDKKFSELPTTISFNKKHPDGAAEELHALFKKGLAVIRDNGAYRAILDKHYGAGQLPKEYDKLLEAMKTSLDWDGAM